jgi:hypothetical protein
LCCSNNISACSDYKHILKAFNLSLSQKRLLYGICKTPTAHLYSRSFTVEYSLTSGSIRSGIKRLVAYSLVCQDLTGIWRIKNEGMQAWLHLLLTTNDPEKAEPLRFGGWDSQPVTGGATKAGSS